MTLTINHLTLERNQQILLSDIHCTLQSGEYLQVEGTNGSGKSTLLRILAGLIEPQQGQILWQDQCIFANRDVYQQQLKYIGHQNGNKVNLTVFENLRVNAALSAQQANVHEIHDSIKKVGLAHFENTLVNNLSAGQARRVSLARLLLQPAPLWILDEPTTALDAQGQDVLMMLLNHHLEKGGLAVIATHQPFTLIGKEKKLLLGRHA